MIYNMNANIDIQQLTYDLDLLFSNADLNIKNMLIKKIF